MSKQQLLKDIGSALVEMEVANTAKLAQQLLDLGVPAYEIITEGLVPGMDEVNRLYEEEEYFLPEVLICSDAFNAGLGVVKPHLDQNSAETPIKVVIGVIEGDTHDIGKNLVRILMESSGFEVHDLGRDVPIDNFVNKAEEVGADLICMSTLMTTTMDGMRIVVDKLKEQGIRDKYLVGIGGGPISQNFADMIGADFYSKDASSAVKKVKELMGGRQVRAN